MSNFGMKVYVKYNKDFYGFNTCPDEYFRNVTEVHYKFNDMLDKRDRVAFESDIHGTGCLREIAHIEEFEVTPELEKQESF